MPPPPALHSAIQKSLADLDEEQRIWSGRLQRLTQLCEKTKESLRHIEDVKSKLQTGAISQKTHSPATLGDAVKSVESVQEGVRNQRQMSQTAFQDFDQKTQQYMNMLAQVIKALNDMRSGSIRNML